MNTGQMLLTTGAMVLLGSTIFTVNKNTLNTEQYLQNTAVGVYAVSFATSNIEKAIGLAFDENSKDSCIDIGLFTAPANLGPDASHNEKIGIDTNYNDFDDYNHYSRQDTIRGVDLLTTRDSVYYVGATTPDIRSTIATYFKRMDIKVYGTTGGDTVKMSYIFSYFRW